MKNLGVVSRFALRPVLPMAAVVLVVAGAGAAGQATRPTYGAASPQALVGRLNAAIAAKNLAEIVNCMDADSRVETSAGVLALTIMMVTMPDLAGASDDISPEIAAALTPEQKAANDTERQRARDRERGKAKAQLAAVLKRHGLPDFTAPGLQLPQGEARKKQLAAADHGALVRDLLGFIGPAGAEAPDLPLTGQVRSLKVSGSRATATAGTQAVALVQRNGRWYLAAQELMGTPK
jgi:hypothetical protein